MAEGLLKLLTWFSPGYPVGAFSYSHGLEWAVGEGAVHDACSAEAWIGDCLAHGAGRSDAILLAHAWRGAGDAEALADLTELARALAPSAERAVETDAQGAAFAEVTGAAWSGPGGDAPYPIAVGHAARQAEMALADAVTAYLHAFAANLVSAAVRLVPLGQTDGQKVLASLTPLILTTATEAAEAPLDALGGCAIQADIASIKHETQDVRLFRS
ncbi:MAG: urease accessory protein UreF [Pseudomonadota bacterium]